MRGRHSLYIKFLLGYLIFGFLGFFVIATVFSAVLRDREINTQAEALYDEAYDIAADFSGIYQGRRQDTAEAYARLSVAAAYLKADIWIIDRDGVITTDTAGTREGVRIEDFDPLAAGSAHYTTGTYFGQFPDEVISASAPITGNYNTYGYVVIHLPMSQVTDTAYDQLNLFYICGLVFFAFSLIFLFIFTRTVYTPLKKINEGARQYAEGNLEYEIPIDSQDEIGYLAHTLNYMSDELNKMEDYQRTFVANVSHDFRSPLTSIKGYLEAILDGTVPPELQEKYLRRVISETERLTKLTEELLTLNSIESEGYLNRTNFDINRVIKDTAASFEGICMERELTFDLTFSDNIEMVSADLGKIQQVLYNLIDNAIKFSHDGSTIYIQTYPQYGKIYVSVKDTGYGIPKESIKKIWDRFYKSDSSRGKDKKGTGLGLSIVREIIQEHGETIDVISTEGVGTEFIFTLTRAVYGPVLPESQDEDESRNERDQTEGEV